MFIEDLVLQGNNYINQQYKDIIDTECRKNLMIKEYILPTLECQKGALIRRMSL